MANEGKVRVWDQVKNAWVWVYPSQETNGKGVTVYPKNTDGSLYTGAIPTAPYIPSSFQVTPGGGSISISTPSAGRQGPGQWGPIDSPEQAAGMIKSKAGVVDSPAEGELDVYDKGGLAEILRGIFGESGGSGKGSKPTISRAVLQKALTKAKNEIARAYDAATPAVASAYANNPYAGFQAQSNTVDPGLSALFQSQGVSSNPLEQMIASNREAATQRGAAMNDMYKMLASQFAQQGTQQQADIAQQRAGSLDDLLQNYATILGSGKVY